MVVRVKYGNIVFVLEVVLLKSFNVFGEWFWWMAVGVMKRWIEKQPKGIIGLSFRIRLIDVFDHPRTRHHRL